MMALRFMWPSMVQLILLLIILLSMHGACWWYTGRTRNPYSLYYHPDWNAIERLATQRRLKSQEQMRREIFKSIEANRLALRFPVSRTERYRICVGILHDEPEHGSNADQVPLTVSELLSHTSLDPDKSLSMTLFCRVGPACDRLDGHLGQLLSLERLAIEPNSGSSALHLAALSHLSRRASCEYHLLLNSNLFVASNWSDRLLDALAREYGAYAPNWFAARLLTQLDRSFQWDSFDVMAVLGMGLFLCLAGVGLGGLLHWIFLLLARRIIEAKPPNDLGWDGFIRPSIVTLLVLLTGFLVVPLIVGKPTIMFMTNGFHTYDPSACGTGGFPVVTDPSKTLSCQEHSLAVLYHHTNSEHLLDLLLGDDPEHQDLPQADDFDHLAYVKGRPLPQAGTGDQHLSLREGMDRILARLVAFNYAHGYRTPLSIMIPNLFQNNLPNYGPAHERPERIYSLSFQDV